MYSTLLNIMVYGLSRNEISKLEKDLLARCVKTFLFLNYFLVTIPSVIYIYAYKASIKHRYLNCFEIQINCNFFNSLNLTSFSMSTAFAWNLW